MPTSYPSGLDNFTNPTATDSLDSATVPHASQHTNINDAVEAIETALGANLANVVLPARTISTTAPLAGGGDLSANRTLSIADATTSDKGAVQLTDSTSSTSTTTAATPNAVKTSYDAGYSQALPFISGYYYKGQNPVIVQVNATAVANTTYYVPFFVPVTTTFDRILVRTGNTFSGTASIRLGIYAGSTGKPTTVVLDAGTVSATASATSYQITINQQLTAGVYFLAANSQTAATINTYIGFSSATGNTGNLGTPFLSTLAVVQYFTQSSVTGAFATASSVTDGTATGGINVFVRAA